MVRGLLRRDLDEARGDRPQDRGNRAVETSFLVRVAELQDGHTFFQERVLLCAGTLERVLCFDDVNNVTVRPRKARRSGSASPLSRASVWVWVPVWVPVLVRVSSLLLPLAFPFSPFLWNRSSAAII